MGVGAKNKKKPIYYGGRKTLAGARKQWIKDMTGGMISGGFAYDLAVLFAFGETVGCAYACCSGRGVKYVDISNAFEEMAIRAGVAFETWNIAPCGNIWGKRIRAERPFLPDWWGELEERIDSLRHGY